MYLLFVKIRGAAAMVIYVHNKSQSNDGSTYSEELMQRTQAICFNLGANMMYVFERVLSFQQGDVGGSVL